MESTHRAGDSQAGPVQERAADSLSISGATALSQEEALEQMAVQRAELERQLASEREANRQAQADAARARQELEEARRDLALAVGKYRNALLAGAPEVPADLVQGGTVSEIDESFAKAQALVARLRRELERSLRAQHVPAGAPPRQWPDLSALSPQQKIMLGLQQRTG